MADDKRPGTVPLTIRLRPDFRDRAEQQAKREGVSLSAWCASVVRAAIQKIRG